MLVPKALEWVRATDSGKDRSKIRPAVPATPIQTAAGCGGMSAHTAEGARWLRLPPHLRPQCKACAQHRLSQGPAWSPTLAPCSHLPLSGLCTGGPEQSPHKGLWKGTRAG